MKYEVKQVGRMDSVICKAGLDYKEEFSVWVDFEIRLF